MLVIEHNLDVLNTADWIIELGPAGGRQGGLVVFEGTPDQIVKEVSSFTGRALRDWRNVLDGQEVSRESFFNFPPMKLSAPEDNTRIVIQAPGSTTSRISRSRFPGTSPRLSRAPRAPASRRLPSTSSSLRRTEALS